MDSTRGIRFSPSGVKCVLPKSHMTGIPVRNTETTRSIPRCQTTAIVYRTIRLNYAPPVRRILPTLVASILMCVAEVL